MTRTLRDGRSLRTFNVIDDFNREGLGIDVGLSLPSARVTRALDQIRSSNGEVNPRQFVVIMAPNIYQGS